MNNQERIEKDLFGEKALPAGTMTGIHTARAVENFGSVGGFVNQRLIRAYGLVKLACVRTNAVLGYIDSQKAEAVEKACVELAEGRLAAESNIAALQGAAGTSTNMLVNELIANRALQIMGNNPGDYQTISPLEHVNLHQSTNDTYPTALRVAAMFACGELEQAVSELADAFQRKEKQFADIVKLGRTQLQDAVLTTLGREMGGYAEAFSKDRWRIYKCRERLRTVNLGGTAIGTGLGAPQKYIFMVADELRKITNLPIARAENLCQATANWDEIVEVSGILKALAGNLLKVSNDLRLLASGPVGGIGEIILHARQAGSSIMPGKVNPVIAEMVGQVAIQVISRDMAITLGAASGQLELNAFAPLIAHNLLEMLDELIFACRVFRTHLVEDMQADPARCLSNAHSSTAIITAFVNKIGYEKACEIAQKAASENRSIREILLSQNLCSEEEYDLLTSAQVVLSLGFKN